MIGSDLYVKTDAYCLEGADQEMLSWYSYEDGIGEER